MKLTVRDCLVAVISIAATAGVLGRAQQPSALPPTAFDWNALQVKPTTGGERRDIVRAPTATLEELEMHVTTLRPGETSHAPHKHPNEELLIVKEGTVEALVAGEWKKVGVGSVIFQASNHLHGIKNVGTGPATYHVVNWTSGKTPRSLVPDP
jgi:quercetin dioxygenase-like cupin family protein